ncbi:hypothetical protein ACFL6U_27265 [Planctomycetota bacterium]
MGSRKDESLFPIIPSFQVFHYSGNHPHLPLDSPALAPYAVDSLD